mgnify:CR=1 FL=1
MLDILVELGHINDPLRDMMRYEEGRPHPLPLLVKLLTEATKMLGAAESKAAEDAAAAKLQAEAKAARLRFEQQAAHHVLALLRQPKTVGPAVVFHEPAFDQPLCAELIENGHEA